MLLMETNLIDSTKDRIKKHEGYRDTVYICSAGKRTIGYGHLCYDDEGWIDDKKYKKELLEKQFDFDFRASCREAEQLYQLHGNMNPRALSIITEMVFQLGRKGVSKFKKMWKAIEQSDWDKAHLEMLDSKWAKQTPKRAEKLAQMMKSI